MMRPGRKAKPAIAQIESLNLRQLQDLLERNERTLRNPSLFASSSTGPVDPVAARLIANNERIKARIAELSSVDDIASQLEQTGLSTELLPQLPSPAASKQRKDSLGWEQAPNEEEMRQLQLAKLLERRRSENEAGSLKLLSPEQAAKAAEEERARQATEADKAASQDLINRMAGTTLQNRPNGLQDELSYVERAARMQSFLRYGPSESDLEWEESEDEDEDAWLNDDDDGDGEQLDVDGDQDMDLGSVIRVDMEKTAGAGGLKPPNG